MAGVGAVRGAVTSRFGPALFGCLARHALPGLAASADLLCSLVLLPSLCPGAAFCALLLTAGTGKFLCRFVLGTVRALLEFTRLETSFPQLRNSCCGFTQLTQLPPQGYTPQPPQGFARPSYPRKGTLRNPRKGSLTFALPRHAMRMRSDAMRHRSSSATNCGGATRSATTCDEMRCDMMRHR